MPAEGSPSRCSRDADNRRARSGRPLAVARKTAQGVIASPRSGPAGLSQQVVFGGATTGSASDYRRIGWSREGSRVLGKQAFRRSARAVDRGRSDAAGAASERLRFIVEG